MATPKRAAIYVRLSDDKKKTGENVADQEAAARKIAADLRAEVYEVYCDNSRPASDPVNKPRPEFLRLIEDAEAGRFDMVICRHVDRFFRHPIDQLRVSDVLGTRGITIHQEWSGYPLDLQSASGVMQLGIHAQVGLYEINIKKERQAAHSERLLKKGTLDGSGPRPFGFNKAQDGTLTPHETEAELVRQATRHVLEGGSIGELVRAWNAQGIKAARGGAWGYTSMRTLLMRWSNAGIRQKTIKDPDNPKKKLVVEHGPGTWEPIVPEDEFRALLAKLQDPGRTKHRGDTGRKHLLAHLLKCGHCGEPMRGGGTRSRAGKWYSTYQCQGLKTPCRRSVDYEAAEEVVLSHVAQRLAQPERELIEATADERSAAATLQKRLTEIEAQERAVEQSSAGLKAKLRLLETYNAEREEVAQRLTSLTQRMTLAGLLLDLTPTFKKGRHDSIAAGVQARKEVRERFDALDLDRKRSVIRALLTVEVAPYERGDRRPTVDSAKERVIVTPLNPLTGQPYVEHHAEAI